MAEEKKEPWLNYLALTTVILAVAATLATAKGNSYSTRSILYQAQATDQWGYYQAKCIKGYLYEMQKEGLERDAKDSGRGEAAAPNEAMGADREAAGRKIVELDKKLSKYEADKAGIQQEAKRLETLRDEAQNHSRTFASAIVALQISILLSSIAALMRKKPLWYLGLVLGAAGLFYFADGFLLFF